MILYKKPKKIIFFGGGKLLFFLINFLIKKKIEIIVFTENRHLKEVLGKISFKKFLKKKKINFFINSKNIEKKILKEITPSSIGISYRYSYIFKNLVIRKFKNRLFNIHSQALPNFRGKGGLSWNILSKSNILGSSIHLITEKIDKGSILMMLKSKQNLKNKNYDQIEKKVSLIDRKLIKKFLNNIFLNKKFNIHKVNNQNSFYWPSLKTKKNAWLNFNWEPEDASKFINAFSGKYGGAFSFYNKKVIRLKNAKSEINKRVFHPYQIGIVYRIKDKRIYVVCNKGAISCEYKLKSGSKIKIGSRLRTTTKKLEQSLINL
ncbi:formyltransferase family protein [Candidatus Pelagibacter sp. Uisw_121]|uniref:formyltransferase family protein n=1 Tax=Candidatus Pelagibacter sp. Uisw_121 TaxID=3230987 RepID=UPI0039ED753F